MQRPQPTPQPGFSALTPKRLLALALLAGAVGLGATPALAEPNIMVTPTQTEAGGILLLEIQDYPPGGYDVSIRFDNVEIATWPLPIGGNGIVFIQVPITATLGGHDIRVCAACDQGDLEQTATTRMTVVSGSLGPDEFNVQIQAIEVTQGVRGPIPVRAPPLGNSTLPSDPGTHVANRRTVVRVYPWMEIGEDAPLRKTACAELLVRRGIDITGPFTDCAEVRADLSLEEMRGNPRFSFNFTLPDDLVQLGALDTSFDLDFSCDITNVFGETNGADNLAELFNVDFEHVGMNNSFAFQFRPFLIQHTFMEDGMEVVSNADLNDLLTVLQDFQDVLPIADGSRGLRLYPWRWVDWEGPFKVGDVDEFDEEMIRTYLPTGRLDGNPQNDYYGFLAKQRGTRCGGHAYVDTPYLITGACSRPLFPPIPAHELTHAIWQRHAASGHGEKGPDPGYPGSHGQVEFDTFGFNVYNNMAFSPESSTIPENQRHDYMSYGPDQWISQYTWDGTAADLGSPAINPKAGMRMDSMTEAILQAQKQTEVRFFTGSVDFGAGIVEVSPVFAAPIVQPQLPQGTDLLLSFFDANNNLVYEHWTNVAVAADDEESRGLFVDAIPVPDTWTTLVMGDTKLPLDTLQRSLNAPEVTNFNLQNGFQWGSPKQSIELTWDGSDADGDPLMYRVIAVRETTEFNILVSDITETSYFVDPAMMPGGGNYAIFIEATDGFDSGFSTIATGWVEPLPPQPIIIYPREGDEVLASTPLRACALYADFQGITPQIPMQWNLDNVTIAEGDKLTLTQLGLGPHTLEITAINDFQKQGSYSVNFFVVDKISPPVLVSPSDGSTGEPLPPMLDWDPVTAADGYQLQIALDPGFTQLIVDDASLFDTQFEFTAAFTAVNYHWRVQALADGDGSDWSTEWTFETDGFPVGNQPIAARVPLNLRVFPNPFNPSTSISYSMAHGGPVQLTIYDLAGRRVRTLVRETMPSGEHTKRWDGRDDSGQIVASGVYLARIQALGREDTQRLVLLK